MLNLGQAVLRPPVLASQIYEALHESIVAGELNPGDRIVIEHVAQQLGVSPTPVREALARLIQQGLVVKASNGRLQVVPLTRHYVMGTYLVRAALEGLAAELAAPLISRENLAELQRALKGIESTIRARDYQSYIEADDFLHITVVNAARNDMLSREISGIYLHVGYVRGFWKHHFSQDALIIHREHQLIVDALVDRDPQSARQLLEAHIRSSGERLIDILETMTARQAEALLVQ